MIDLVEVAAVEARIVPYLWAWAAQNAGQIAANWARRRERTPALFDGRILMVASSRLDGDVFRAEFFEAGYADMLGHIDGGFADPGVANGFGMGALQGRDGGFLIAEMAAHTANAGRLYFPAGTPDRSDVAADGTVDLASSILREIREETGLAPGLDSLSPGWTIVRDGGRLAFMRDVRLDVTAEAARDHVLAHLAAEPAPELSDIRIVRSADDIDAARMPGFLPEYLRSALARPQR